MKHETRVIAAFAIFSSSFIIPHSSFAAASADALVADPYRAVDVTWMKHPVKGADYWIMLHPSFLELKGLEDEPFVKGAGIAQMIVKNSHKSASSWGYATPDDFYRVEGLRDEEKYKDRLARVPFTVWNDLSRPEQLHFIATAEAQE